jgi:hypothetical protein
MARKRNDRAEITSCVRHAADIVDEALPRINTSSSLNDPVTPAEAADQTALRATAFGIVLKELLDYVTGGFD